MNVRWVGRVLVFAVLLPFVSRGEDQPAYLDSTKPIEMRVDDLLARMTLEEKVALVHADSKFSTAAIPRLGIPKRWMSDGPMGVREEIGPDTWNAAGRTDDFVTAMPASICLAATWDVDLAKLDGQTIGEEARARGKDIMLGPAVNIQRTPLCGRNFEYMGEDPWLTSRIAVNYIQGEQSRDVASCVKHFALNNQEQNRGTIDVEVDERALREIYLPAFEAAVKEAGVFTVMGAYNQLRGQHCCESDLLLNKILKGEWKFTGLVMSDWGGVHDTKEAALNGLDLEMGTDRPYNQFYLADAFLAGLKSGEYPMSALDDKVRRNLRVMFATKVFDKDRAAGSINTRQHQQNARKIAEDGIVLLKNEAQTLPLDVKKIHSIAVIGDNATRLQAPGGQSSGLKAFYEISPLDGIIHRAGRDVNVTFSQGYFVPPSRRRGSTQPVTTGPSASELIDRAVAAAKSADVAIIIGGLNKEPFFDTEGTDRKDMKLPYGQDDLIRAVVAANPHTIVVLVSGSPVEMNPWLDQVPAVIESWYGGSEADINPSGKLPCTFPRHLEDSPAHALHAYPGENGVVEYKEGLLVGYRWFDTKQIDPQFCFGHGLSYTKFDYSNLKLIPGKDDEAVTVQFDLQNIGDRDGSETAQIYLHYLQPRLEQPEKQLKGFSKIFLKPGQQQTVTVSLPRHAFEFYDPQKNAWVSDPGDYEIRIGSSSRDIRLHDHVQL
jgi:beta-glucosidase